jgi:predicted transcriptional regulator
MSKATGFRLDEDILPNLKKIAKEQERSVNWLVNNTLKNFIEGEKKKEEKDFNVVTSFGDAM